MTNSPVPPTTSTNPATPDPKAAAIVTPLIIGCVVALTLGVYGHVHEPAGFSINLSGFSSGQYVKSWLATVSALLGVIQLATARLLYRPNSAAWLPGLHRWSGRLAVLVTVPVVVHCLFALGFESGTPRVLAHSLLGCLFYGVFVAKMLSLTRPGVPKWGLPVLGGLTFTALVGLWLTSALWVFSTKGFHF